ncbi:MAG: 3-oxoacyl-[acyl-carrier-protein] reductase [Planctomycetes bacterium]|nr:3-oxoacyl-[acyl-carrier-protein] reductase [Planctomycetota bacterium]
MAGRLEGRVALVTGASRGIGRAIALAFAEEGADVALVATNEALLASAAEEVQGMGRRALALRVDLADAESIKDAVESAKKELGGLDIVVNNAGITADQLLLRHKDEDWDRVMQVNLGGAFRVTKAAARYLMKSKAGRVINISSVVGLTGNPGQSSYAASKAGLIGFSKSVAKELASRGVTVNVIAPGFIETDMTAALTEEQQAKVLEGIPLGRMASGREIAHAAVFLASDAAAYITGEVLRIDGGLAM